MTRTVIVGGTEAGNTVAARLIMSEWFAAVCIYIEVCNGNRTETGIDAISEILCMQQT